MRIFFDLDGTIAKWEPPNSPELLYKQGFYACMQTYKKVEKAFREFHRRQYDLFVLTCYPSDNIMAVAEKTTWLRTRLSFNPGDGRCIFTDHTKGFKGLIEQIPDSISNSDFLIDDDIKHLEMFKKAGGNSIRMINDVNFMEEWNGDGVNHTSENLFNDIIDIIRYQLIKMEKMVADDIEIYHYQTMYTDSDERYSGFITLKNIKSDDEIEIKKQLLESRNVLRSKLSTMDISTALRYLLHDIIKHSVNIKIENKCFVISKEYLEKTFEKIKKDCRNSVDKKMIEDSFISDIERFKDTDFIKRDDKENVIIYPDMLEFFDFIKEEKMMKRSIEMETRYFLTGDRILLDVSNEIKVQFEITKKKQQAL